MEKHFERSRDIIRSRRGNLKNKEDICSFISKLFLVILVLLVTFNFIFGFYIVYNDDMFPKLVASDLLIYYRLDRSFYVGDLVVLQADGADYALRLVAGPGDEVDIQTGQGLYINGAYQAEAEIFYDTGQYETDQVSFPLRLEEDQYLALGDMRRGAKDSRYFGPVSKNDIKGKVFVLLRRANF